MKSFALLHRDLSRAQRYGVALAVFGAALLLRISMLPVSANFPFLTFYPATVATLYLCGTKPGLLVAALSAVVGYYVFIPPHWTFVHSSTESWIVGIFMVGVSMAAVAIHQLQGYARSIHGTLIKLQDSESRFRMFMNNSTFLAWVKDDSGRYVFANVQYEKRLNWQPGSWQGKRDTDLFSPALAQSIRESDQVVLNAGQPVELEDTTIDAAGKTVHWLLTKFSYIDSDGRRYLCGLAIDITERKVAEDRIESLAFYDPLTGLPNRRLLLDRLAHVLDASSRNARLGALLFIDLDNFKTLNDTLGHDQGDLLLQMVAERLVTNVRKGDTLARLGGDEFVVLLEDLGESALDAAAQAETVAESVLATLGQPYMLGGHAHHSTPSIGITLIGETSESLEEPLKRADLAMYQAKAAGRNTLRFFDPRIQSVINERAHLETELRAAVAQQQLLLHYQPQVDTDRLIGAEVLVRWRHPERGIVSPADFIPLAEDTGLIVPLGRWVLDQACAQLALWATQPAMAQLTIAVNVSPYQFHQANFVDQVLEAIANAGANSQMLKLELTEGMLITSVGDVISKMARLKKEGVSFSLDDFGTGYSSLAYLKRLPLDQLKIDQSFVKDILVDSNDAAIATTIIALAKSLSLAVIAEGVETEAQRDFLAQHGCSAYQGYLCSRPLPLDAFEAFARSGQLG